VCRDQQAGQHPQSGSHALPCASTWGKTPARLTCWVGLCWAQIDAGTRGQGSVGSLAAVCCLLAVAGVCDGLGQGGLFGSAAMLGPHVVEARAPLWLVRCARRGEGVVRARSRGRSAAAWLPAWVLWHPGADRARLCKAGCLRNPCNKLHATRACGGRAAWHQARRIGHLVHSASLRAGLRGAGAGDRHRDVGHPGVAAARGHQGRLQRLARGARAVNCGFGSLIAWSARLCTVWCCAW